MARKIRVISQPPLTENESYFDICWGTCLDPPDIIKIDLMTVEKSALRSSLFVCFILFVCYERSSTMNDGNQTLTKERR